MIPARRWSFAVAALLTTACGGATTTPTPTPTASPTATATPTPQASAVPTAVPIAVCSTQPPSSSAEPAESGATGACEVAQILLPPSGTVCEPSSGSQHYADVCPVTQDLGAALDRQPLSGPGGGADPVCRCQNTYSSATYLVSSAPAAGEFTVQVKLVFGTSSSVTLDVIVESVESGSLASDILCGSGDPSTSIKGSSPGPCS